MINWREGDIQANGIRLHYYRSGGAKPPVVLSHGLTDSGRCWRRLAPALAANYDVIAYDARGHGRSEAPETGYSAEERAADLAGLIDALGLDRPALIGHSMGADVSVVAAALYPSLARCIVLEDPPWRAGDEPSAAVAAEWRAGALADQVRGHDALLARNRAESPAWDEIEREPWVEAKLQVSPRVFSWLEQPRISWQAYLPRITCPILLITADPARGAIVTPEIAQQAASLWRSGSVIPIDGAGHNIRREQFDSFLVTVTAFLGKHI